MMLLLKTKEIKIFIYSFLILYLELVFIRLFPAQITLFGYYTNFILIATFAGIGLGFLLAKYKFDLRIFFPWLFLITSVLLSVLMVAVIPNSDGEIALEIQFGVVPEYVVVPFIFLLVVSVFAALSQNLGKFFDKTKPLTAYKWDVLGSVSGVLVFATLSYLRANPIVWLLLFCGLFLLATDEAGYNRRRTLLVFVLSLTALYFGIYKPGHIIRWSPYQKLSLLKTETGHALLANNMPHQGVWDDLSKAEPFYYFPYQVLENKEFQDALIIGSGMGTDVAIALKNGVKKIDAVDIDPEIYRLGLEFNPSKVYQDPRITFVNNDARAFLSQTDRKYDLIIFALPDSLVIAAGRLNMRLESFLFTKESFYEAKKRLKDDGLIVLYNYYRQPFIVDRLTSMLNEVFEEDSYVLKSGPPYYPAAIMNGGALNKLKNDLPASPDLTTSPIPATDDWPFLYMQKRHIPIRYLLVLGTVLLLTYLLISKVVKGSFSRILNLNYFFLGVGFFLIETKSIVQFSLLFGTTWITSTLVIVAVLTSVFLATQIAHKKKVKSLKPFYFLLFLSLFLQYVFPQSILLPYSPSLRYLIVSVVSFLPVFFANIIFSFTFKESKNNSVNFASNMFGAVIGGSIEYLALLTGYKNLVLIIALCYFLAFFFPKNFSGKKTQFAKN